MKKKIYNITCQLSFATPISCLGGGGCHIVRKFLYTRTCQYSFVTPTPPLFTGGGSIEIIPTFLVLFEKFVSGVGGGVSDDRPNVFKWGWGPKFRIMIYIQLIKTNNACITMFRLCI